ncbi:MAG: hypothetical protein KatS3mg111_0744 [Pirellulaceae bacterium]|nr:MAG: hypothetical protein KatS3mg111_0744 [Pirellulaceae bacterium]
MRALRRFVRYIGQKQMRLFSARGKVMKGVATGWLAVSIVAWVVFAAVGKGDERTEDWKVGLAKIDITPQPDLPVRLSGYASRTRPHEGIADRLHARAMVLVPREADGQPLVLVSIDAIMVTRGMTREVATWLHQNRGVPRSRLVLASTHSHAAPHLDGGLENLFSEPLTQVERQAVQAYTADVVEGIKRAIDAAWEEQRPARLSTGYATAGFAINRRLLRAGKWVGFGEHQEGLVDRTVRVLLAQDAQGQVLGAVFQYACHCTTMGDYNRVSGDWAGLAATELERRHPNAVFLPVIGCGADANPHPRGSYPLAVQHAQEMVDAVQKVTKGEVELTPLQQAPTATFGYAGLAPELPTSADLDAKEASSRVNERRWATYMKEVLRDHGRLPETVPMPIHVWRFGDQLVWVFLGGEVVVEYQHAIAREFPDVPTWVAAYCDDVFAYVASEAMRAEGGYEVDSSMIYYLQPGRWQSGTQSRIVRRVVEIARGEQIEADPLGAAESLRQIRVPPGWQVELVAAEPLIADPVNIAFGADGRLWVVEMADYPTGNATGGRVRWLIDEDADGVYDRGEVFLDGLEYPTSVHPWGQGVLVATGAGILLAEDRDGDGRADAIQPQVAGFHRANPQHRCSGFQIGFDGWLHLGAGDGTKELRSLVSDHRLQLHGGDVAWNPRTGQLRETAGATQFIRSRDAYGNWFGNSNSRPIFQLVIDRRYVERLDGNIPLVEDLLEPAFAPPVYPRGAHEGRFNDLFARDRFTSACSAVVVDGPSPLGDEPLMAFVCEPVHRLVARYVLEPQGGVFRGRRHPEDQSYDFFTSTDPWSRPVRAIVAPDGSLWIVDMVRRVIEHPQWIPAAWQEQLDLRAGEHQGRIYRVAKRDRMSASSADTWAVAADEEQRLLAQLCSPHAACRDLVMEHIATHRPPVEDQVREVSHRHTDPRVRMSAYGTLAAAGWLDAQDVERGLQDDAPSVVAGVLRLSESLAPSPALIDAIRRVGQRDLGPAVDLQWILTVSLHPQPEYAETLASIAARSGHHRWITRAFALFDQPQLVAALFEPVMGLNQVSPEAWDRAAIASRAELVRKLWKSMDAQQREATVRKLVLPPPVAVADQPAQWFWLLVLALEPPNQLPPSVAAWVGDVCAELQQRVLDADVPRQRRRQWWQVLALCDRPWEEVQQWVAQLLDSHADDELKHDAILLLAAQDRPEVAELLLSRWPGAASELKARMATVLLTRRRWAEVLLTSLETGDISARDFPPTVIQQMRQFPDRDWRARADKVLGRPSPRWEVVAHYLRAMPPPVDRGDGGRLFVEHCAACHAIAPQHPPIGPPLNNLQHWTTDQWVQAILDPNAAVEPKYRQVQVLTRDDEVLTGVVVRQDEHRLQVALADGSLREVPVSRVARQKETSVSLMPEGFEGKLSPEDLAQLIAYLRSR